MFCGEGRVCQTEYQEGDTPRIVFWKLAHPEQGGGGGGGGGRGREGEEEEGTVDFGRRQQWSWEAFSVTGGRDLEGAHTNQVSCDRGGGGGGGGGRPQSSTVH